MKLNMEGQNLKAVLLFPLALSLAVFAAVNLFAYIHQEAEYTEEYVDHAFLSAQRVLDSAVRTNTDKLSATLNIISRDEVLKRAMSAGDQNALLNRATPIFEDLRKQFGITHFYFIRPDRAVFLRVHQPRRYGDVLDRVTAKQAEATGMLAAGLELGPAGTFTLRTVVPWRDGKRLLGYIELGEEIGYILGSIREMLGLDLYVTIKKKYLSQPDWAQGIEMLNRQAKWDFLPDSVVVFQTMQDTPPIIQKVLAQTDLSVQSTNDIADKGHKFLTSHVVLNDAGRREVGSLLFIRDVTARSGHSQRDMMLAGGVTLVFGMALFGLFYLVIGRVERRLASSQLKIKASEENLRLIADTVPDILYQADAGNDFAASYVSLSLRSITGFEPAEFVGKNNQWLRQLHEIDRDRILAEMKRAFDAKSTSYTSEYRFWHKDGTTLLWFEDRANLVYDAAGKPLRLVGVMSDITARKLSEKIIQESTQRLSLLFQQTPLAVIEWNIDFRVVEWNPAAEKIFGYSKAEAVGRHAAELILPQSAIPNVELIWDGLLTGQGGGRSTNENVTRDGKKIYCEWYNTQQVDVDGQLIGVASLAQDVTDQKFSAERAIYLAYYDELTGLPNRIKFKERLLHAFIDASLKSRLVGIILLDIDHFKGVNDTLGHAAGNELLQAVTKRLQGCFRPSDTLARFGGDEFTIAITDVSHVDDVVKVAQHIVDIFNAPFLIFGNELFVTFSMGISLYPFDDGNVENLLRNADSAMYAAKAEGRNCYRFYALSMTERATQHFAMQTGLRRALDKGELFLHYQPQLEIGSHRIIGVEALVRWQHPEKGIVSPMTFIPVAEETGLIVPMGEWILREACMQVKAWQKLGHPPVRMAVNLSARQFKDPLFSQRVFEILNETGLDPQYLELEVTESILVDGLESVSTVLQRFKQAGITISLDDFGTGYSSLSYLKRFPIDKLKIDQSFVRDVLTDASDASLVRAIIAMSRALHLKVIAEGVETQGQFDFLSADGCDEIQGYLIGRPMPAAQVAELIVQYATLKAAQ